MTQQGFRYINPTENLFVACETEEEVRLAKAVIKELGLRSTEIYVAPTRDFMHPQAMFAFERLYA